MTTFQELNLNPKILNSLKKKGYSSPTAIQSQAIPHIIEQKDVLGIAQTGTGKTAAFALPILHNLAQNKILTQEHKMRTLILTPTRELATQILENIENYAQELDFKVATIFGGVSNINQIKNLKKGCDIIIATPGRLIDLMNQNYVDFSQLEIFVLDEADRMLDLGFIVEVDQIIKKLPKKKQTLLFSATLAPQIAILADNLLKKPVKIKVTPESTTVEKVRQLVQYVKKEHKSLLLKSIIKQNKQNSILVFSRTKRGANKIVAFLEKNAINSCAIHSNKSQTAREQALDRFKKGEIKVLVATDIAARGIDIADINYVINYEVPSDSQSYVHRIGRTARAGKKGIAITFCDDLEKKYLTEIENTTKSKLEVDKTHPYHDVKINKKSQDKKELSYFAKSRKRYSNGTINENWNKKSQKKKPRKS